MDHIKTIGLMMLSVLFVAGTIGACWGLVWLLTYHLPYVAAVAVVGALVYWYRVTLKGVRREWS